MIMLTVESCKDNVMHIVKMGVKDYRAKPFKGEDLIGRVQKFMQLKPKSKTGLGESNDNKYFSLFENVSVMALPAKFTQPISVEVEGILQTK